MVSDYIHLNPVRTRIVPVARLIEHRYSSYWYLRRPRQRPPGLRLDLMLAAVGQIADTAAGWDSYDRHLEWQAEVGPTGKSKAYVSLGNGWALGSADFIAALLRDHTVATTARAWESKGSNEIREQAWEQSCRNALQVLSLEESDIKEAAKAAAWKIALAVFLKVRSQASNRWLGRRLHMGSDKYVSYLVSLARSRDASEELVILRRQAT